MTDIEICEKIVEQGHCGDLFCPDCPLYSCTVRYETDEEGRPSVKAAKAYLKAHKPQTLTKEEAIIAMVCDGVEVMRVDTSFTQVFWKYLNGMFFYGEIATNPSEMHGKEYKIVEPVKRTVKKWLWVCYYDDGVYISNEYYATEEEARKYAGSTCLKVEKALWSEIEVASENGR